MLQLLTLLQSKPV